MVRMRKRHLSPKCRHDTGHQGVAHQEAPTAGAEPTHCGEASGQPIELLQLLGSEPAQATIVVAHDVSGA